jgi:hypothetical protein
MYKKTLIVLISFLGFQNLIAQDNGFIGGFQLKTILGSQVFGNAPIVNETDEFNISIQQQFGYSFGMTIRKQFTPILAVESGLRFTQRNYTTTIDSNLVSYSDEIDTRIIAYEIPIKAMVRLRASDNSFFNVSLGGEIDLYPSDVFATNNEWQIQITRRSWIQGAFVANLGWEINPIDYGTFYVGFSYNQPFVDPYSANVGAANSTFATNNIRLNGAFFALDFRYYFEVKKDTRKK